MNFGKMGVKSFFYTPEIPVLLGLRICKSLNYYILILKEDQLEKNDRRSAVRIRPTSGTIEKKRVFDPLNFLLFY